MLAIVTKSMVTTVLPGAPSSPPAIMPLVLFEQAAAIRLACVRSPKSCAFPVYKIDT